MKTGTVKWFNNAKGFGFILEEGGDSDIFAHYSSIDMDGYKTLKAGQSVQFETVSGPKGLHAAKINSIGADSGVDQDITENGAATSESLETID